MAESSAIRAGRAFVELFADDSRLVRGLRAAEKKLRAFGDSIRNLGLKLMGLSTAVLTPLVAAGRVFAGMGSEIADLSVRTGVGVETLSELGYAAEQSGTSLRALGQTLFRMNRRIANAATGSGPAVRALREMGFSAEQLARLDAATQFKLIADRLNAMTNPALAAQFAFEVLGDNARDLMPLLRKGSAGMDALAAEARELGLTMQRSDVRAAEALSDAMGRLWEVVKMTTFQIGAALAPTLTRIADTFTRLTVTVIRRKTCAGR